jgi:hypothetical protein
MKFRNLILALALCGCSSPNKTRTVASEAVTFDKSDFVMAGPYALTKEALAGRYRGVAPEKFGTFEMTLPNQKTYLMRELHYRLYAPTQDSTPSKTPSVFSKTDLKKKSLLGLGVRALPVTDGAYRDLSVAPRETMNGANGEAIEVVGSKVVDDFLYQFFGFPNANKPEPIFTMIAYSHPEKYKMNFLQAPDSNSLKTEGSITHLGVYVGQGQTKNSPFNYHSFTWQNAGYPPILFAVNYSGADSRTFNQNALITMKVLNEFNGGPKFPTDYKKDYYQTENLKANLDFYRAWIDTKWVRPEDLAKGETRPFYDKLQTDETWATYCAEHVTIALNVALNLPQNLAGYQAVYGMPDGTKLWNTMVERWKQRRRVRMAEFGTPGEYEPVTMDSAKGLPVELTLVSEKAFMPLWKKMGGIYSSQEHGIFKSPKIEEIGYSLAWAPETTADLLSDYIRQYGDFIEGSPALTAALIYGFSREAMGRMGLEFGDYFKYVKDIIPNLFSYHTAYLLALDSAENANESKIKEIYQKNQAELQAYLSKMVPDQAEKLTAAVTQLSPETIGFILEKSGEFRKAAKDVNKLKTWVRQAYHNSVKPTMAAAQKQRPAEANIEKQVEKGLKLIEFYSPPAVVYRVSNGHHDVNPHVQIAPIATILSTTELEKRADQAPFIKFPMSQ